MQTLMTLQFTHTNFCYPLKPNHILLSQGLGNQTSVFQVIWANDIENMTKIAKCFLKQISKTNQFHIILPKPWSIKVTLSFWSTRSFYYYYLWVDLKMWAAHLFWWEFLTGVTLIFKTKLCSFFQIAMFATIFNAVLPTPYIGHFIMQR